MEKTKTLKINHLQNVYFLAGILLSTISTVIIILSAYILIQTIVKPNSPPTIFGVIPQIIMTDDMSGNNVGHIENGDLVFIQNVPIENIEIQNVVAYIDNGNIFVSRVTEITTNGHTKLTVRADNIETEYLINDSQILGTITKKVAFVGEFIYFTQSTVGIIVYMVIPSLVLITLIILDIVNKKKMATSSVTNVEEKKTNEIMSPKPTSVKITKKASDKNSIVKSNTSKGKQGAEGKVKSKTDKGKQGTERKVKNKQNKKQS